MDVILWTAKEAAKFLGVSHTSLATWRSTGQHDIPFVKIGGGVRYLKGDLMKWVENKRKV